ncbi:MAG: rRNA methyltransferase [Hyphomicrobiales bacterium]|nr:MAG: rRNA methyltransferase [Hyphomicrobiales bacterium]
MAGTDTGKQVFGGGPAAILVRPQLGQNIGTAARAMANFGLDDMRLVAPRDGWPSQEARKAASGADHVVDRAGLFETTEQAVSDLNFVLATTARNRDMVKHILTPEEAARELHRRIDAGEKAGILFGPERTGLHNDEVALADALIMAPVNPAFASLNLAQAVLLIGYEWFKPLAPSLGDGNRDGGAGEAGLFRRRSSPATKAEMIGLFEHLEQELDKGGFLLPIEKRPNMVRNLRNLFHRADMTEQEVRTMRGVISALVRQHERMKG